LTVIYVEQCLGGKLGEDLKPTEMMGDVRERERERGHIGKNAVVNSK